MRGIRSVSVCVAVFAALLLICSTSASATVYNVNSSDYTRTVTLSNASTMDNFELTAKSGEHIKYSVSVVTSNGCAQLFFSKGHNINMQSEYLVAYSQENCVQSFSKEFPVGSSDGTDFTVTISTSFPDDMDYTVTIKTFAPAIPDWLVGFLVIIVIIVIVAVIGAVIRGRRKKAAQAQMMPQWQPPQQPPFPPEQPPYPPQ
jgi:flagellar biosynthesis/type III secretory pathway M-ring protein FliF/YscJ